MASDSSILDILVQESVNAGCDHLSNTVTHSNLSQLLPCETDLELWKCGSYFPGLPEDVSFNILARVPRCRIHTMRQVCRKWYSTIGGKEYFDARRELGLTESWVYAAVSDWKGCNSWFAFDLTCKKWHLLPPIPGCEQRHVLTLQFSVLDGKLLVSGMVERENPIAGARGAFLYDPTTNKWRKSAPSLVGRWFCMSGVVDGKLYVAGGLGTSNNLALVQTVETYDVQADVWKNVESAPPLEIMTLPGYQAILDDTLYAKNIGWGPRNGVAYNPVTGTRDLCRNMVQGWSGPSTTLDGLLYSVDFGNSHRLKVWTPQCEQWQFVGEVVMGAGSNKAWAVQLSAVDGKLCLVLPDLTLVTVNIRGALHGKTPKDWSKVRAEIEVFEGVGGSSLVGESSVYTAAVLGCQVLSV